MKKGKNSVKLKDIVILSIVLLVTIICLIIYVKDLFNTNNNYNNEDTNLSNVVSEKPKENAKVISSDEELIKYLSSLGERDRMEYYCGEYFKYLKHKEYDKAYELLYEEFKQKYFPTLEEYKNYVVKFYPEYFSLIYDDITRQGDIYVLRLNVLDVLNQKKDDKIVSQNIVIRENNYNDFVLSFQVE